MDYNLDALLKIIEEETIPAIGCTEPIAVALASYVGKKYLESPLDHMEVETSKGFYKNGKYVKIPGSHSHGLDLAAALGYLVQDREENLLLLEATTDQDIEEAQKLVDQGLINLSYLENSPPVFVRVRSYDRSNNQVEVSIQGSHNHIEEIRFNDNLILSDSLSKKDEGFIKDMAFVEILDFIEGIDLEKIEFVEKGIAMNMEAAQRGIMEESGLRLGQTLSSLVDQGLIDYDGPTRARILTTAAADIRMGGTICPVMTSTGSGNQGLGIIIPIYVISEIHNISREKTLRAIFLAHIINKQVKLHTGKLSYMCGCAIAAGMGASAGIAWMLDSSKEQIIGACNNMLANLTGLICDGAKESCSLKLGTSAAESIIAAYLARENVIVDSNIGVIGTSLEQSFENIGTLCNLGGQVLDTAMIKILSQD